MSEQDGPVNPPREDPAVTTRPTEPGPPRRPRRLGRGLAWALLGTVLPLVLLVALVTGALVWVAGSASGTAWLLSVLPGITVTAPKGSLVGDFAADRLEIALPGASGSDRIAITGLRWRGLSIVHSASARSGVGLAVDSFQAERVDVQITPDPDAAPLKPPESLQLPLEVDLRAVEIAEIQMAQLGDQPLRDVRGQVHLGADAGSTHRIDGLSLGWDRIATRGSVRIENVAPFGVDAKLAMVSRADAEQPAGPPPPAFDAELNIHGPLARLDVKGALRGSLPGGRPGAEAPSLDLEASVLPFDPWPLGALQAQTRALDLSALHGSAPGTSLSGTANVVSQGTDLPATVAIALTNARAGRYDEGLLPVRSLTANARARPDDLTQIDIQTLELVLGTARAAGGQLRGNGRWSPQRATLTATLTDIAPQVLDGRAPAMRLSGSVELTTDSVVGTNGGAAGSAAPPQTLTLRGRIDGSLPRDGRNERVQLDLDATALQDLSHVELRRANLQAGNTRATLTGQGSNRGRGNWQVKGRGALTDLDPAAWWPGAEGSAWRKGPHRFNGTLDLDGLLPTTGLSLQRLATLQGQAALRVTDSLLAGAPLAGDFTLRGEGAAGLNVNGSLALAGTQLALRGRLDPAAKDHWELEAHAADVAQWSPLLKLVQPADKALPVLAGALDGEAQIDGRWPQLASRGRIELKGAGMSTLKLGHGALRWTVSADPKAPLEVLAEIDQLTEGEKKLDSLRLSVKGTAAEHGISLNAASPVRPPKWVDLLQGADDTPGRPGGAKADPLSGTLAELQAQGSLEFDTAWQKPLRWRGQVQQLDAKRRGGKPAQPWFHAAASALDVQYDPATRTPKLALGAGRAELPNLALHWSQVLWQGGSAPSLDVQAAVEPFSVAPLLARLQPDFGWSGDLMLTGTVNVHSSPGLVAEVVVERQRGDLKITDETGTQPLELTDLRLALDARDGVWHLTQALAGRTLGAMSGALTVRTDPKALRPPADAPLEGVVKIGIADLAPWGAWAPTGWRLRGSLDASASFGGQFGAPTFAGQVNGSALGARNLVEGIDFHDGELDIVLDGETAQIRKLRAQAGNGSVEISGSGAFDGFGAPKQAKLRLVADKLLLLGRVDRRIVTSGDATLQLDHNAVQLDGRFTIDQGLIDFSRGNAPSLGDDVIVLREPASTVAEVAPRTSSPFDLKMNLSVDLGPSMRVRGRGLNTRLAGDLLLSFPDGRLAVNGTVRAVDGTYAAYGQNLTIQRGVVAFSGPYGNPRLDVLALRPNLDIRVGVAITGNALSPRIALYSEPDLPDNEKLSWLVLGRAPDATSGSDTAMLQAAAMALLAGEGEGVVSQLARLNPLDVLSVRQTDSAGNVRSTVLSVGKQLSRNWYIGYERSLSATAGNWQLIYRLAQQFTVRLQAGLDNSIDLIWSWRWD